MCWRRISYTSMLANTSDAVSVTYISHLSAFENHAHHFKTNQFNLCSTRKTYRWFKYPSITKIINTSRCLQPIFYKTTLFSFKRCHQTLHFDYFQTFARRKIMIIYLFNSICTLEHAINKLILILCLTVIIVSPNAINGE